MLFHFCILFWRYVVYLVIYLSVFFQNPTTFLYWCGFIFSIANLFPYLLVRWMSPELLYEIMLVFPNFHTYIIRYQCPFSIFIFHPCTLKPPLQASNVIWCFSVSYPADCQFSFPKSENPCHLQTSWLLAWIHTHWFLF